MEQKEDVRHIREKAEAILNRLILGKGTGDHSAVRDVLAQNTPDEIVRKFTRPDQGECKHLKGGAHHPSPHKDYAVRTHTFPDGRTTIKCIICGREWDSFDPVAREMARQSSNTPSASEIIVPVRRDEDKDKRFWRIIRDIIDIARGNAKVSEAEMLIALYNADPQRFGERAKRRLNFHREDLAALGRRENDSSNR